MPRQTRNTEALRAKRKVALEASLLSAVESLHDDGLVFGDMSVERLITTAGVTRSTFYSYFEDKDALLRDLAGSVLDDMLQQWLAIPPDGSKADFRRGIDEIFVKYRAHRVVMLAIDEPTPGGSAEREFTDLMGRSSAAVARYIKAGQSFGTVDKALNSTTTAALLMWMSERGLAKMVADAPREDLDTLAEALTEIFFRTLRGGAGT
jgi:TetR/AcrR family transcriptional regulator, ethionamide resistance regulator